MTGLTPGGAAGRHDPNATIPWRERPNVTVQVAAVVIGVSTGKVYDLAARGELELVSLAGRTLVTVPSLIRFVGSAIPYTPDSSRASGAARRRMAAQPASPVRTSRAATGRPV